MSNNKSSMVSIKGYEGLYSVTTDGDIISERTGKKLKPYIKDGYCRVSLRNNGKQKSFSVHRLVAAAFIPNPEDKETVNHIDCCKTNNCVENLEWATPQENITHAVEHGLMDNSIENRKCKPIRIIETGECYKSIRECARAINGNFSDIAQCLRDNCKLTTYRGFHFEYINCNP